MGRYLAQRLLHAIFVIWGAATLVFLILHLSPGDPAINLVGENATDEQFEMVRRSLGLDRPLHERYLVYMSDLLQGTSDARGSSASLPSTCCSSAFPTPSS